MILSRAREPLWTRNRTCTSILALRSKEREATALFLSMTTRGPPLPAGGVKSLLAQPTARC